jgi:two-component system, chemotaxis family, chemotaxis protein CheY
MMTGYTERARIIEARDAGVSELVAKPIVPARLLARLDAAVFQPRPFVKSPAYIGPSRRRSIKGASGPRRRASDDDGKIVLV